jgi:hypothetical protein
LQRGREAFRHRRDVEQDRLATLAHGEPAKFDGVHARRTEQLGRGAEVVETIRLPTKAKGDADFFVGHRRVIRWERRIEVALVMRRTALYRGLQEPIWKALSRSTQLRQANGQA